MGKMLAEMQREAQALYSAGEYHHALAEFSVLAEIRSRREGPYSVGYLSNLHDCVRCMSKLQLWSDSDSRCRELYGKYVRTHGRGQNDTVDVAKHWAWALVHLADYPPAVRLYLLTADALWDTDPAQARRLVGAAVVHRHGVDPALMLAGDTLDGVSLGHGADVYAAVTDIVATLPPGTRDSDERVSIDGLAIA